MLSPNSLVLTNSHMVQVARDMHNSTWAMASLRTGQRRGGRLDLPLRRICDSVGEGAYGALCIAMRMERLAALSA